MGIVSDSLSSTLGVRYRRLHKLISSLVCLAFAAAPLRS
jgi:hypothetical protein